MITRRQAKKAWDTIAIEILAPIAIGGENKVVEECKILAEYFNQTVTTISGEAVRRGE